MRTPVERFTRFTERGGFRAARRAYRRRSAVRPGWARPGLRARVAVACLACLAALSAPAWSLARAHFLLDTNIRIIHVEHLDGGVRVFMRLPMPIVVAGLVGAAAPDGSVSPAPYTYNRVEDGQLMHYFDIAAFRSDPLGLGALVAAGHGIFIEDGRIPGRVEAVRAYPAAEQTRFTTLEEVHAAMQGPPFAGKGEELYVGEVVLDVQTFHSLDKPLTHYWFASRLAPDIEGIDKLANLLVDHWGGEPKPYRATGTLAQPIEVTRGGEMDQVAPRVEPAWAVAVGHFIWQGVIHIWQGADHVLFVICLTVGALGLRNLLWRITGFTLGHTVTLIAGFFGFAPSGPWFIPTIEAAIALSIVYAGAVALMRSAGAATFLVTTLIGLLHGLGFSFVLHTILQVDSPNLWPSLISFNVGVEIGQVAIILIVWPSIRLLERVSARSARYGRVAVVSPCIAVALVWTIERILRIWAEVML